jgi:hypothetical protein
MIQTRNATKAYGGMYAILAVIACGAIVFAGSIVVTSSPVLAQFGKKNQPSKSAIINEFQKKRSGSGGTDCKIIAAGFVNIATIGEGVVVQVLCPGNNAQPEAGVAPQGREQEVLSIALASMTSGKPVTWAQDNGAITFITLGTPQ